MRVSLNLIKKYVDLPKDLTDEQIAYDMTLRTVEVEKIEKTAQAILKARSKYANFTFADMYGEKMYLFPELLEAHRANDRAVMEAYGFDIKTTTESSCVSELMKMYQQLVEKAK